MCMRILLVEDDDIIAEGLCVLFRTNGYVVDHESTIAGAKIRLDIESYDCLVIDRGLPDGDGAEVVIAARKMFDNVSILCLTAKNKPNAIIEGLDVGADEYLSKPFLPDVLLAHVRSLIRRKERPVLSPVITLGEIQVNTNTHVVTRRESSINLSPKEFHLLEYLLIHRGEAIERQTLLEHVWGEETDMFSNTVDVHIRYLRKKLDCDHEPSVIVTVRGKGYMICSD